MVCVLTVALSPEQEGTVMSDHLELLIAHTGHCRDGGRWYDPLRIDLLHKHIRFTIKI